MGTGSRGGLLQFHLLPIRDWNQAIYQLMLEYSQDCNFIYSLLGIETEKYSSNNKNYFIIAISFTPY